MRSIKEGKETTIILDTGADISVLPMSFKGGAQVRDAQEGLMKGGEMRSYCYS